MEGNVYFVVKQTIAFRLKDIYRLADPASRSSISPLFKLKKWPRLIFLRAPEKFVAKETL